MYLEKADLISTNSFIFLEVPPSQEHSQDPNYKKFSLLKDWATATWSLHLDGLLATLYKFVSENKFNLAENSYPVSLSMFCIGFLNSVLGQVTPIF